MHNQARPTCQNILKISLGLGGIFQTLCVPALAETNGEERLSLSRLSLSRFEPSQIAPLEKEAKQTDQYSASSITTTVSTPLPPQFSLAAKACVLKGTDAIADTRLDSQSRFSQKLGSGTTCQVPSPAHIQPTEIAIKQAEEQAVKQVEEQAQDELPILASLLHSSNTSTIAQAC